MKEPEPYETSSCPPPQDAEGARLPEPLWDDPDYRRREREWNATAGDGWPHPEPQSAPEQTDMPYRLLPDGSDSLSQLAAQAEQDGSFSPQYAPGPYAPPPGSRPLRPAALELAERQLPAPRRLADRWFFWLIAAPVTGLAAWEIFSCAPRQPVWLTAVLSVAFGVLVGRLWRLRPWRRSGGLR
jgi:hypothetical protein